MSDLHVFESTRELMPTVRFGELFFDGATLDDLRAAEALAAADAAEKARAAAARRTRWIITVVFTVAIALVTLAVVA